MSTRLLLSAAVILVVLFGANCSFSPSGLACVDNKNTLFEGCFEGDITAPAGSGKIKLVLNTAGMPETKMMAGCAAMSLAGGEIVTLAGEVQCGGVNAKLQGLRANGLTLKLNVRRQPANGNAVTVDVTTEDGTPFASALAVPRCAMPVMTCLDLGMRVPFGTGGQP